MNNSNYQPFVVYDWVNPETKAELEAHNVEYWEKKWDYIKKEFAAAKGTHKDIMRCYTLQELTDLNMWKMMDRKERNVWSGILEYYKNKGEPYSDILKDCITPKAKWIKEHIGDDEDGKSVLDVYQESIKNRRLAYYKACNYSYTQYFEKYVYWKDKDPDTAEAIGLWMEVLYTKCDKMDSEDKKVMKQFLDVTKAEDISVNTETLMRTKILEERLNAGRSKTQTAIINKELTFYKNGGTYEEWRLKKKTGMNKPDVFKDSVVSFNLPEKKLNKD